MCIRDSPALFTSLSATSAYQWFNCLLAPLGLWLTVLGGFALARGLWGAWPALVAALALVALPDAAQQGVQNAYFSYHWLQAATPGLSYGVALIALAWLLMFTACRTASPWGVAASYLAAALCLVFKAHIFVAGALLLWIFPPLYYPGLARSRRLAWLLGALALFAAAIWLSQDVQSLPLVRPDGSALKPYLAQTNQLIDNGALKELFGSLDADSSLAGDLLLGSLELLVCSFGVLTLLWALVSRVARRWLEPMLSWFPWLVLGNYLAMALFLAFDSHVVGTSDELLHRPFVWAYFVVVLWLGGACYRQLEGDAAPRALPGRLLVALVAAGSLLTPLLLGQSIQKGPDWPLSNLALPGGLVECTEYLRQHSDPRDLVQDSANDPMYVVSALSQRQAYLIMAKYNPASGYRPSFGVRLQELAVLRELDDAEQIRAYARKNRMRWYLMNDGELVAWPAELLNRPAFVSGNYRVYCLY
jgi:hypothetical protein